MFFEPAARPRSTSKTENFSFARASAAADPAGPAPTTTASNRSAMESRDATRGRPEIRLYAGSLGARPDFEIARVGACGDARNLFALHVPSEQGLRNSCRPAGPHVADRLEGSPVRRGERSMLDPERVSPFLGSKLRHRCAPDPDHRPHVGHPAEDDKGLSSCRDPPNPVRHCREDLLCGPLAREVHHGFGGVPDHLLELLLDCDEELETEEHDPM